MAMRARSWPGIVIVAVLVVLAGLVQTVLDRDAPARALVMYQGRFVGATILGFKDVAADLLWVRANMLFWDKQFVNVIPLFRIITLIDPHYTHVYMVGAWHFAWNLPPITKCGQEETERWYRAATTFMQEGIRNNPGSWRMYFEMGWLYFQKSKRYDLAAEQFAMSVSFEESPMYVGHMLGHSYERNGEINRALRTWERVLITHPDGGVAERFIEELSDKIRERDKGTDRD